MEPLMRAVLRTIALALVLAGIGAAPLAAQQQQPPPPGSYGPGELTDYVISYLGADANPSGTLFSHTADGIGNGLAVHTRVKEQVTLRVHDR